MPEDVFLTSLTLIFKGRIFRHRLIQNTQNIVPEKEQELVQFRQGHIVLFVREIWKQTKFLTTDFFVIKTLQPRELGTKILGVHPAAQLLLRVTEAAKIKRTIQFFENLREKQVDLRTLENSVLMGVFRRNEAIVPCT